MNWNWVASWRDQRSLRAHRNVLGHLQHVATEDRKPTTHPDGELIPHVRVLEPDPSRPVQGSPAQPARPRPGPVVVTRRGRGRAVREPEQEHRPHAEPSTVASGDRTVAPGAPAVESGAPAVESGAPVRPAAPRAGRRLVFIDDGTPSPPAPRATPATPATSAPAVPAAAATPAAAGRRRARRGAGAGRPVPRSRPPRLLMGAAAVVAVAVVVSVALALGGGHHRTPRSRLSSPAPASTSAPQPPPTSVPVTHPATLVPTSTGTEEATYTVSAASVQISLSATRECWVELRSASAAGPLLFQGVLTAGTQRTFQASGLWLRIGYPAGITLDINGSAVTLPVDGSPFNVTVDGSNPA